MATVQIAKDGHSFYIVTLLDTGEQIQYDWALSASYSVIVPKGVVSIGTDVTPAATRTAIGLYRVPPGEKLICDTSEKSIILTPFVLDDAVMDELVPIAATLSQLRADSSHLTPIQLDNGPLQYGEPLVYNTTPGNIILTLSDIDTKILGAIAA